MHYSRFQGVLFVEGSPRSARDLAGFRVELGGVFSSGQLRSLDDVKRIMAAEARSKGRNAVVDFRYGQRSVGFWRSLINRDDVVWYGVGSIANVDPSEFP